METRVDENLYSEIEYPFLIAEEKGFQLIVDNKFRNGFYMEVYVIQRPSESGYMSELWSCPYKALAYPAWERYTK